MIIPQSWLIDILHLYQQAERNWVSFCENTIITLWNSKEAGFMSLVQDLS